jgi:steroid 5-alpha reductase family enzyme
MTASYALPAFTVFVFMAAMYVAARRLGDNSIVDVCWGIGYVLVTATTWMTAPERGPAQALVSAAVIVWAIRLAVHIFLRNHGKPEDRRYAEMRQRWADEGHEELYSFVYVFMMQACLIFLISLPIIHTNARGITAVNALNIAGALVWLIGFFFEAVGDWQLSRFKQKHPESGSVMDTGLWRYTRHPNYFGETLIWWGIFLMALKQPADMWLILSPAAITFLLLRVSGIPMAEEKRRDNPAFAAYVRRTNAFFPGPPKA